MKKVVFIGSKHLGLAALEKLCELSLKSIAAIITIDDRNDVRCKLEDFRRLAKLHGIKLFVLKRSSELKNVIMKISPNLCIVVGWYWILKPEALKIPKDGFLGIHASFLPKYRGFSPLVWPLVNGEKESGVTLFYLDGGMDTGDVVDQLKFKINRTDNIHDIMMKAEKLMLKILGKNYKLLLEGRAPKFPQDHRKASYGAIRVPDDGKIDWQISNEQIYNLIRALTLPYPGAFTFHDGKKLFIWRAELIKEPYYGSPGLITQFVNDYAVVTCGQGALLLKKIQFENGLKTSPSRLLKFGTKLG